MALIGKWVIFDLLFTLMVTREKTQKFLWYIYHLHTYTYFAHSIDFFVLIILQKNHEFIMYGFSLERPLVLILIRAILEQFFLDLTSDTLNNCLF